MTLVVKSCQLLVLLVGGLLPTSLFSINGNNLASEIYIKMLGRWLLVVVIMVNSLSMLSSVFAKENCPELTKSGPANSRSLCYRHATNKENKK